MPQAEQKQRVYAKYRAISHLFFYRQIDEDLVHKWARRFSESRLSRVKKRLLFQNTKILKTVLLK